MNTTGSSSRIEVFSRPLVSDGVDGYTTLRPAVWMKCVSGFCEWWCPPLTPPPAGMRITIGAWNCPPER